MMKTRIIILCCLIANIGSAQIIPAKVKNRLKQKSGQVAARAADRAADRLLNKAVDRAVDKGMDKLEEKIFNEGNNQNSESDTKPGSSTKSSKHSPTKNEFIGFVEMKYSFFKNEKEEKHSPSLIEMHLIEDATAIKMKSEKGQSNLTILHLDDGMMTVVTESSKGQTAIRMQQPNIDYTTKEQDEKIEVNKTGNTKTIDGYHCEEYIITTNNGIMTSWISKDLDYNWEAFQKSLMSTSKTGKNPYASQYSEIEGFPILSTVLMNNGKDKVVMKLIDFKNGGADKSLFNLNNYQIMEIPNLKDLINN